MFATYPNGVQNHRVYDLYKNGVYFNLEKPIQITQGLSYLYTPSYGFHRSSCADVRKLIADVTGKVYDVEVQPFMSNAKDVPEGAGNRRQRSLRIPSTSASGEADPRPAA